MGKQSNFRQRKGNLAFAYLSVSGRGQFPGGGFPRQRAVIEQFADAHGITIKKVFEERGVSGTREMVDRPALQEMLVALMSNPVRKVIVEKLGRLARNLTVQEAMIRDLTQGGFEIISVSEPNLCSNDPSRKRIRRVFGAIAEYEKTMIVLKLKAARQRIRAKTGRCEGRKPFGQIEEERDTIRRMKELASKELNYTHIANTLNSEGRRTQTGSTWFPATVSRTLAANC